MRCISLYNILSVSATRGLKWQLMCMIFDSYCLKAIIDTSLMSSKIVYLYHADTQWGTEYDCQIVFTFVKPVFATVTHLFCIFDLKV